MVANLVCTTDSSSAKSSTIDLVRGLRHRGQPGTAVTATVGTVPPGSAEQLHDLGGACRTGTAPRPGRSADRVASPDAANASVSPCPACSRAAA